MRPAAPLPRPDHTLHPWHGITVQNGYTMTTILRAVALEDKHEIAARAHRFLGEALEAT